MSDIATELKEILGSTGGGYLRDEQVTTVMKAATALIRFQQVVAVIDKCRESVGLEPSPDGPTGDVTNLLHRGDVAERQLYRAEEAAAEDRAAARETIATLREEGVG